MSSNCQLYLVYRGVVTLPRLLVIPVSTLLRDDARGVHLGAAPLLPHASIERRIAAPRQNVPAAPAEHCWGSTSHGHDEQTHICSIDCSWIDRRTRKVWPCSKVVGCQRECAKANLRAVPHRSRVSEGLDDRHARSTKPSFSHHPAEASHARLCKYRSIGNNFDIYQL